MSATSAPSAAPPNAIPVWSDGRSLFTELPGPHGPIVLRYPLTTSGLSSALGLIHRHAYDALDRSAAVAALSQPRRSTAPTPVELALRKLGLIP